MPPILILVNEAHPNCFHGPHDCQVTGFLWLAKRLRLCLPLTILAQDVMSCISKPYFSGCEIQWTVCWRMAKQWTVSGPPCRCICANERILQILLHIVGQNFRTECWTALIWSDYSQMLRLQYVFCSKMQSNKGAKLSMFSKMMAVLKCKRPLLSVMLALGALHALGLSPGCPTRASLVYEGRVTVNFGFIDELTHVLPWFFH